MKKLYTLVVFLFLGCGFNSWAAHIAGAEISYQHQSANTYQVNMTLYRDCASLHLGPTEMIVLKSPGCNNGRNIVLNQVSSKFLRPFGPSTQVGCAPTAINPNYQIYYYSGILTFSATEATCMDWVLSWTDCCRVSFGNVTSNPASPAMYLYAEAKLKLTSGLVNSSPAFDTLHAPILFVNYNKDYSISMAATDPNGDSLVYSLVAPLEAANTPVTYTAFPQPSNGIIFNPNPLPPYSNPFNPQVAQLLGSPAPNIYTPTYPFP